ncbi:hypothetical protein CAPTEDRAFT_222903 [Capitella teleta]|uniref:Major facilitator superfamily (MFS) profile domain-containing protein n=1 Tax=Capitella teleta TaxID=283909 RepID=R7TJ10_CAPTE|nr:hypothetical protein CAPTEDRAFT_222903 [Capitella teleta]|eukprot:ELT93477.1 hypothetical protein CAPTEDRAFT_222903 [Capitella teleta]
MTNFEELLTEVNEFGPFQVSIFVLVSLFEVPAAWAMVLPLFTASSPKWHCTLNTTHLNDLSDLNHTAANSSLANCQLRRLGICDEVVYDEKFTSIITEWDLECSDDLFYVSTLLKILQMVGVLFGAMISGQLADILGRRKVFYVVYSLLVLVGIASSFANSWQLYVAFRVLIGAFIGGTMVINFVLPLEFVGCQWRTFCGCIGFWAVGVATLPLLAYFLPNWRHLAVTSSAVGIPLIFTYWWIPESPRWLIQKGRYEEATLVIKQMAQRNRRPCTLLSSLIATAEATRKDELTHLSSAFAHVGKASIAGAWAATQVSSAEQFPTVVRSIGISSCSMAARIGAILAPQIVYLGGISMPIPYIVYGSLALISAVSFIYLPETLNRPLVDAIPFWNCACYKEKDGSAELELDIGEKQDLM